MNVQWDAQIGKVRRQQEHAIETLDENSETHEREPYVFTPKRNDQTRLGDAAMTSMWRQKIALVNVILVLALFSSVTGAAWALAHAGRHSDGLARAEITPSSSQQPVRGLSLGFAMADFTGDTHPDLATVELDQFDSGSARYVIEIRLTEGGHQFLGLIAPLGGLLITPMDVTGDGNLDLVVRGAKSHLPVAIFLNDGHGRFVAAQPDTFAQLLGGANSEQDFAPEHFSFSAALVSPKSHPTNGQTQALRRRQKQDAALLPVTCGAPSNSYLTFGLNRAPPAFI